MKRPQEVAAAARVLLETLVGDEALEPARKAALEHVRTVERGNDAAVPAMCFAIAQVFVELGELADPAMCFAIAQVFVELGELAERSAPWP
jgi:hypothetical protein